MSSFFETNSQALSAFARMSCAAGARADYVQGGGGNTSVKLAGGQMAIKASGYRLSDIRENAAYAVLNCKALSGFYADHSEADFEDAEKAGAAAAKEATLTVEGLPALRPSVEAGFHSILDTYVIHSHSVYCNLASCALEGRDIVSRALADAPYSFGFVPYVDPGARLTFAIKAELARITGETGKRPAVIFMQNHGVIAHADSADECLFIHDDVNSRIAEVFGIKNGAFPADRLEAYIRGRAATGKYGKAFFIDAPLYPDQMVYLIGTLEFGSGAAAEGGCILNTQTGALTFNMDAAQARIVEETIAAVLFIAENVEKNGYTLSTMGDAAKKFIANWESEKYRKALAGGKK